MFKWILVLIAVSTLTGMLGFSANGSLVAKSARLLFFAAAAMLLVISALVTFNVR